MLNLLTGHEAQNRLIFDGHKQNYEEEVKFLWYIKIQKIT